MEAQSTQTLEQVLAEYRHEVVFSFFSVVELWRLRRVCRAFRRWGVAALAALPRVVVVGGRVADNDDDDDMTTGVEVLSLSTLRWTAANVLPTLPEPRLGPSACSFGDGRLVVVGGRGGVNYQTGLRTALQWVPGATSWESLPNMLEVRSGPAVVALPDGRTMVIGGFEWHSRSAIASVEVLAANGSGWSALKPMGAARTSPAAALLPCGKVLVTGGEGINTAAAGEKPRYNLKTAEVWDPTTEAWTELPSMAHERSWVHGCVLPSGRVAVVGGADIDFVIRRDGELFDPEEGTWQPMALPPSDPGRHSYGMVAVSGGLLLLGGPWAAIAEAPNRLFDEASGRWFALPHPMAEPRYDTTAVLLPAAAFAAVGVPS